MNKIQKKYLTADETEFEDTKTFTLFTNATTKDGKVNGTIVSLLGPAETPTHVILMDSDGQEITVETELLN